MAQIKIKQINGLQTALNTKVETASNPGFGVGIFDAKVGTDLRFFAVGPATGGGVKVDLPQNSPSGKVIQFSLSVENLSATKTTPAVNADDILIVDSVDNTTKKISFADFVSGIDTTVDYADFTPVSTTADTDSIIFFDSSNANATHRQTKAEFLVDYAKLASPNFTGTPTAPTATAGDNSTQIATTAFVSTAVSNAIQGLDAKASVRVHADTNINLASTTDPGAIDGVTLADGDRILLTGQTTASENGIYDAVTAIDPSTWVRSADADGTPSSEVTSGMYCFVEEGTAYASTGWILNTPNPITVDTTALTFVQFSKASDILAGNGLSKTGNTIDVNVDGTSIEIVTDTLQIASAYVGQTSITTLGTITTGTWNGATIGVAYGGTGLTTISANSVLASGATADTLSPVAMSANTILGRGATGDVSALTSTQVREVAQVREVVDTGTLTSGSMTLATLTQTPRDATALRFYINGILLEPTTDYTVSGQTVTATNALNVAYGGTTNDGLGFENDDVFQAVYEY